MTEADRDDGDGVQDHVAGLKKARYTLGTPRGGAVW
jgi:hypothetical protein